MKSVIRLTSGQLKSDLYVLLSIAFIAVFFVLSGTVSFMNVRTLNEDSLRVTRTHDRILSLNELLSLIKDAETGQRGYVLQGDDAYLAPYRESLTALAAQQVEVRRLLQTSPEQLVRLNALDEKVAAKLSELEYTINLRRNRGFDAANAVIGSNRGKSDMDSIRILVARMQDEEQSQRLDRIAEMNKAKEAAILSIALTATLGVVLCIFIGIIIRRAALARRRQDWLQGGQAGLSAAMLGEQTLETLARNVLKFLTEYCGAQGGVFYGRDGVQYRRVATFGVADEGAIPLTFTTRDRLLGQVASDAATLVITDAPEDHMTIAAGLGQWRPRHLAVSAARSGPTVDAVIELGFLNTMAPDTKTLLGQVSEFISIAVQSANYRANLQNLLEETQRQSEELQTQSEELRVNNEELEEQSRALRESHLRLEQQQAELEQINTQLEDQARILEDQKADLTKSAQEIEKKAEEVEQASRYKSDFLANMSHELRTPLNSSLILAKLLGDNPDGNLTEEQVTFARTIQSSGNDLLALINDILDLSKIEAGHMDIRPETVSLTRLIKDLARTFDPIAKQKGLTFVTTVAEGLPGTIETDRQRLEQVLKNLLSNAFKFTETGSVELKIAADLDGLLAFNVIDTGVGISHDHHQAIFDAFRQADGTISRKYGGTGLGLSISRELARLLGGSIRLESERGKGSTFTVVLPAVFNADHDAEMAQNKQMGKTVAAADAAAAPSVTAPAGEAHPTEEAPKRLVQDDRDHLLPHTRTILVIEDDVVFARILYDLAHDMDFQCLIATTAEEALSVARQYMPSAVVLDVGLPDHSGLSVLDRLKRDVRTRHIPVHVVSGGDYTSAALSLGAVGYMLKPVKREELVDAFKQFEQRLSQQVRRILIVEDDPVQRDSVERLLKTQDVETVAVGTAAECLERLKESTYDCMVLDLSLPDASGYSLLETLSQEENYAFPPVIVYTGRDLSYDDEQLLRRYSKSIIIKGAKSPERLLDEVTLFLHQVVSELSPEQQTLIKKAKNRDAMLEGRRLLVVEDDVRNVYAVTAIFEPLGAKVQIARNGLEALEALEASKGDPAKAIDLVLMDVMMPEMDGLTATRELRKKAEWKKLPVIMLTAKAMRDDQEKCLQAGANDYLAKPLDVEKLVSLVRVWMPR